GASPMNRTRLAPLCLTLAFALNACAQPSTPAQAQAAAPAEPARAVPTEAGEMRLRVVASGLEHPWAVAPLPDGGFLVTERPGRLRRISADGSVSAPLAGVPAVWAHGQGGLLDVVL